MKQRVAGVLLMSAMALPAWADDDRGLYLVGVAGETTNISNVNSGPSVSGLFGYKFNSFFSAEAGMTLLTEQANYIVPPVGYTVGSTYTSTSIAGSELAARLSLPLGDWFSLYARLGYANMERTNSPSPAEVEVAWKGTIYGAGLQVMLPGDYALGSAKMNIGFRLGVNNYSLTDATGLLSETPTTTYAAGVVQF